MGGIKGTTKWVFAILAVVPVLAIGSYFTTFTLGQLLITTPAHIAVAVILWRHLTSFQRQFQKAYIWLSIGYVMLAVGAIEFPILEVLDAFDSFIVTSGIASIPFILLAVCTYKGTAVLTNAVGVRSWLGSLPAAFGLALALGAVAGFLTVQFLPVSGMTAKEVFTQAMLYAFLAIVIFLEAILVKQAASVAGNLYKAPLNWLFIYTTIAAFGDVLFFTGFVLEDSIITGLSLDTLTYMIAACVLVRAAVSFSQLRNIEQTLTRLPAKQAENSIDIITLLSQLASNTAAIDLILEDLRELTASLSVDRRTYLTPEQQQKSAQIFNTLLEYLTHQESARRFTREGLLEMVELRYGGSVQEPVFWQTIKPAPLAAPVLQASPMR